MRDIETTSIPDACAELGCVPDFVKMDIEGAEVSVVDGSRSFLKEHSIHFAIESNHVLNGKPTSVPLESILSDLGYKVRSSEEFGQLFTWAAPSRTKAK